jgi:hypothetical protein
LLFKDGWLKEMYGDAGNAEAIEAWIARRAGPLS